MCQRDWLLASSSYILIFVIYLKSDVYDLLWYKLGCTDIWIRKSENV